MLFEEQEQAFYIHHYPCGCSSIWKYNILKNNNLSGKLYRKNIEEDVCFYCEYENRKKIISKYYIPILTQGTEKQIKWATKIRHNCIKQIFYPNDKNRILMRERGISFESLYKILISINHTKSWICLKDFWGSDGKFLLYLLNKEYKDLEYYTSLSSI